MAVEISLPGSTFFAFTNLALVRAIMALPVAVVQMLASEGRLIWAIRTDHYDQLVGASGRWRRC